MKICSSCEIVLEDNFAFYKCPIRGCCGEVIEIDDNILETYKILNRKGYITLNSCAGHVPTSDCCSPSTYVSFMNDDFIEFDLSKLPDGFMTDEERQKELYRINPNARSTDTITIRKCYDKNLTDIELQKEIWKSAKDLLEWAESLECNECYGCEKCEDSDENTA